VKTVFACIFASKETPNQFLLRVPKLAQMAQNPWKVNMCPALFEEIWLQNNNVMDF